MPDKDDDIEPENSTLLNEADRAELTRFEEIYRSEGSDALSRVLREAARRNPVAYVRIMAALAPDVVREQLRDAMAEAGMTADDVREMIRKLEIAGRP